MPAASKSSRAGSLSPAVEPRWKSLVIGGAILAAALIAYHNSFRVPLLLDDDRSITTNATIRQLWPLSEVLAPPANSGASGRPLLNLTYAVNYAIGGENVFGYHVFNLIVHGLAGLLLFGVLRRTLASPRLRERFGQPAPYLAGAIAILWAVHPLQTETITYISQRAEALMAVCYLATLYGFWRSLESPVARRWRVFSIVACWLGMATKEAMVTAPFVVFVVDWIFVAGKFSEVWRMRRGYYLGLAASWLSLAWYMHLATRTVGFDLGVTPWTYALTECRALVNYLHLALWPSPLVFDYGPQFARDLGEVLPQAIAILGLLGATLFALRRWPAAAFLGVWFFVLLAPSSSVVPVALQPIAENRMYLPLAAIITGGVLIAYRWLGANARWLVWPAIAGLMALTISRNGVYRDELTLWRDTVAKAPGNFRAHDNLGNALDRAGRFDDAIEHYREALRLTPESGGRIHYNLGIALYKKGRPEEAIHEYEEALRLEPSYAPAQANLAAALAAAGRGEAAETLQRRALQLNAGDATGHYNLGLTLYKSGKREEAISEYREALKLDPDLVACRDALGTALAQQGRTSDAVAEYEKVLVKNPDYAVTHNNLGTALLALGRTAEAKQHYERAVQLRPDYSEAHGNLGAIYLRGGDVENARRHLEEALRLDPANPEAHFRLGNLFARSGRLAEAVTQWEDVVRVRPGDIEAHNNLGLACARLGRFGEAIQHYEIVVRLRPDFAEARENLARLKARSLSTPEGK